MPDLAGDNHLFTVNSWVAVTAVLMVCYGVGARVTNGRFAGPVACQVDNIQPAQKQAVYGRASLIVSTSQSVQKRPSLSRAGPGRLLAPHAPGSEQIRSFHQCRFHPLSGIKRPGKRPFLPISHSNKTAIIHKGKQPSTGTIRQANRPRQTAVSPDKQFVG